MISKTRARKTIKELAELKERVEILKDKIKELEKEKK